MKVEILCLLWFPLIFIVFCDCRWMNMSVCPMETKSCDRLRPARRQLASTFDVRLSHVSASSCVLVGRVLCRGTHVWAQTFPQRFVVTKTTLNLLRIMSAKVSPFSWCSRKDTAVVTLDCFRPLTRMHQ